MATKKVSFLVFIKKKYLGKKKTVAKYCVKIVKNKQWLGRRKLGWNRPSNTCISEPEVDGRLTKPHCHQASGPKLTYGGKIFLETASALSSTEKSTHDKSNSTFKLGY